jgi:hypothetical protein
MIKFGQNIPLPKFGQDFGWGKIWVWVGLIDLARFSCSQERPYIVEFVQLWVHTKVSQLGPDFAGRAPPAPAPPSLVVAGGQPQFPVEHYMGVCREKKSNGYRAAQLPWPVVRAVAGTYTLTTPLWSILTEGRSINICNNQYAQMDPGGDIRGTCLALRALGQAPKNKYLGWILFLRSLLLDQSTNALLACRMCSPFNRARTLIVNIFWISFFSFFDLLLRRHSHSCVFNRALM